MNKKLRLLVITKCPNKCPMCCNNSGEPLIHTNKVAELIRSIRVIKVYVYTSIAAWNRVRTILAYADDIVLTPHSLIDVERFVELNNMMQDVKETDFSFVEGKSLRLNLFVDMKFLLPDMKFLFANMKLLLPEYIDLSLWNVKEMEWVKDCSVPQGEAFRRIKELW